MVLYSTSCSSSSFCLSVGNVTDTLLNNFPVVETYSGGNWSVALAPMPANSASPTSGSAEAWDGTLTSVSCPSDGECAAVGDYNAYDPTTGFTNQSALLESLTAGVWSTVEGALPSVSLTATIVNLDGVSCPTTTSCDAVGALTGVDAENDSKWIGLLYLWSDSGWQLGSLPIPPEYDNSLEVNSVACADVDDCVAVGFYEDAKSNSYGLILTMSGGVWIATDAPLPENAIADPDVIPSVALYGVDCPQVGDCVAGGLYTDSSVNTDPLLEVLQSGTWTPLEGPEPADAPSGSVGLHCERKVRRCQRLLGDDPHAVGEHMERGGRTARAKSGRSLGHQNRTDQLRDDIFPGRYGMRRCGPVRGGGCGDGGRWDA
jgi:hypothetical protein